MCVNSSCGCGRDNNCGCNNNGVPNNCGAFRNANGYGCSRCNNCNRCGCNCCGCSLCGLLNNLLWGNNRSGCGCHHHCGCGCNNNRAGNNSCFSCFDAYYARQYGLNMGCCGRNDWFECQTRSASCCNNVTIL